MSAFDDYLQAAPAAAAKPSFDQYVGAAPATPAPAQAAPQPAPSQAQGQQGWTPPNSFLMGVGNAASGTAQGIVHGLSWLADKVAPNSQFAQDARAALPQMQQTIDQHKLAYDQSRDNGGVLAGAPAPGIDWGRLAGEAFGTAPAMLMGPEYASLSLPGKIALGATQGAIGGGMMPTNGADGSFADQKLKQMGFGAAMGGTVPLVAGAARAAGNGFWNVAQPVLQPERYVGKGLANAMNPADAAAAAANIRNAPTFVPGSLPTTAQAAQTPFMVQTEKAAGDLPAVKTAMMQRAIDNNDARWSALMGVAGTPADLTAATAARDAAASPLYAAAHQSTANVGPAFMRYAQIPEMQQAMQTAQNNAALDAAVGRGVPPVWPQQGGSQAINGSALDYTSRALGDMINDAQRAGANSRAASLTALKNNVDNWTQRYIPGVDAAKTAYAQGSVPINTMGVGQEIANSLGTRAMNAGGAPEIGLVPFRSALTKAMNSGDAAKYGIDANALGTLQGIGQDLQRATVSNSVKQSGSDTAYNLAANGWLARNLYGPTFGGATPVGRIIAGGATALAGHPIAGMAAASGMGKVGQMVGNRLQSRLSGLLMDPQTVLPYLDARAASAQQAVPNALVNGLLNYGRPAATTGLISGFQNSGNK